MQEHLHAGSSIISTITYLTASASTVGLTPGRRLTIARRACPAAQHSSPIPWQTCFPLDDVADDQQHQAAGPQAAEMAVLLHQGHRGPGPLGGNGGRHAGRPRPDHEHVGRVEDRQFAPRLNDLAVHQGRTGSAGLDLAGSDDVALKAARQFDVLLRGLFPGPNGAKGGSRAEAPSTRNQSRRFIQYAIRSLLLQRSLAALSRGENAAGPNVYCDRFAAVRRQS